MNRISFLNRGYAFKGLLAVVNHPWWMSMLFHRRGLLWLGSAVRYTCTLFAAARLVSSPLASIVCLFVCSGLTSLKFNIICHITMVSGCDRELNAHFYSAASLLYQIPDTFT